MKAGELRNIKRVRLLELVYRKGTVTRSVLSAETGLNPTSTVRLVAELRELGMIHAQADALPDGPGRPTESLTIEPGAGHAIGLEFGRDTLIAVITDAVGRVKRVVPDLPLPPFAATEATLRALIHTLRQAVDRAGLPWDSFVAVGVALHDVVTSSGEWATWDRSLDAPFPARPFIETATGRTTVVDDVSRAFAKAEHEHGAGRGAPDMVYVFIGKQNVGAGLFVNGEILRSTSGVCGEVGHIIVEEDGPLCQCGNRGCFEAVASGDALAERYRRLVGPDSPALYGASGFVDLCGAAGRGEAAAQQVLHGMAQHLGPALASGINVSGATLVLIGGHLRHAGAPFLADLTSVLRHRVIPALAPRIEVRFASDTPHAGAWGAALLALDEAWRVGSFLSRAGASQRQEAGRAQGVG